MKKVSHILTLMLGVVSSAYSQYCPSCIQNSSIPQTAIFNVSSATIRGQLTVGSLSMSTFSVVTGTATQFYGGGTNLTNLNASQLKSGTVSSTTVTGPYYGITGLGTISSGTWDGTLIGTQYGGTGQNFINISTGSIIYFSTNGVMTTLLPGYPQELLQTNGYAAPVWVSSPTVNGKNIYGLNPYQLAGGSLPTNVLVSSNSINYVNAASVYGTFGPGVSFSSFTGTILLSQLSTGTLPTSVVASSITSTNILKGVYGDSSHTIQVSYGTDGRASTVTVFAVSVPLSGLQSGTLASGILVPAVNIQSGTLGGSVVASSVAASGVTPGTYGGSGYLSQITLGRDGRVTSATQYAAPSLSTSTASIDVDNNWSHSQTFMDSVTVQAQVGASGGFLGNLTGNASGSAGSVAATGVNAGAFVTGVKVSTANISPGFNGASEIVQLTSGGILPVLSGANLTNLPGSSKFGFLSATNQTLGVGTFSFGYTNAAVTISSISVIVTTSGTGGSSGTIWACCYGGSCVSATSSQGAAIGSTYTGNGAVAVPAGGQIVLQMTSTGESTTPTINAVCGYQ